ncbi:MAG: hypothetical protein SGPRY_005531 [Prymnesium sp.]
MVAVVSMARHGQRSPYPPPEGSSAAGLNMWSPRPFPSPAAWNMSREEFDYQLLTPNGKRLPFHLGEFQALRFSGSTCDLRASLIADSSIRDVQTAQYFAAGFFPESCVHDRSSDILIANKSAYPHIHAAVNDHTFAGCAGPDAAQIALSYGGDYEAMARAYAPQIERISSIIGCCSVQVCSSRNLPPNCSLADLHHSYDGLYYRGFYDGPLSVAGYFSGVFMLQAVSGLRPFAWGELSLEEVVDLYRVHQRVMWLGSQLNSSRAYGSHGLAYLLASLEQVVTDSPIEGLADKGLRQQGNASQQLFLALFGHDFNILYLRRLLRASWVTDSWNFDAVVPSSDLVIELYRENGQWHVVGSLIAASIEQQRDSTPLVPPHKPPSQAIIFDEPYRRFRQRALDAIDAECVLEPLRSSILAMSKRRPNTATGRNGLSIEGVIAIVFAALTIGGLLGGSIGRSSRSESVIRTPMIVDLHSQSRACGAHGNPEA